MMAALQSTIEVDGFIRCEPSGLLRSEGESFARPWQLRFLQGAANKMQPAGHRAGPTQRSRVTAAEDLSDVEKVLAGDYSAFEGLVRRWQNPLVNLAYRFCGDRGRAEDMAQEAFLRAYRSLGTWRRDAVFSTWLFALATNVYCSELRRIPPRTVPLDDVQEPKSRPTDHVEDESRNRLIRQAVRTLPAKYREVLVLFYFHDMSVASAARSLSLPEGTVKARLSRGRTMLRRKLLRLLDLATWKTPHDDE
jgi:RNA polymerase sigma-70 factor, ECF subfamily